MLSFTFHAHAALKLASILPQKSAELYVVPTICSSTAKTSTMTLIFLHYIRLPITRTFQGNRKLEKIAESTPEKNSFYCIVKILITFNCRNVKILLDYKSERNVTRHCLNRACVLLF